MQENINKYGTTLRHPKYQLNEINTLGHCPPHNLPKSPTLVSKMGKRKILAIVPSALIMELRQHLHEFRNHLYSLFLHVRENDG